MDFGTQPVHEPFEGAERRQIDGGSLQGLDRPIDEIGGVAHGFGRIADDVGNHRLGRSAVVRDGKVGPHRNLIAIQRLGKAHLVGPCWQFGDPKLRRQVSHDPGMDRVWRREASEVPARFQQHRQQQATGADPCARVDESEIGLRQVVAGAQFVPGQPRTRPRIGRAVSGGHSDVRKRVRRQGGGSYDV